MKAQAVRVKTMEKTKLMEMKELITILIHWPTQTTPSIIRRV